MSTDARKKVIIRAPAFSRSGYGEQTRFALRALRKKEDILDLYLINIPWGQTGCIIDVNDERRWMEALLAKTNMYLQQGGQFDASLQVTIPNEWEKMAPVNIGFTAGIETTMVAPIWLGKGNEMDKIIVVSNHSKEVYQRTVCSATNNDTGETVNDYHLTAPINAVNYAVRKYDPVALDDVNLDYEKNFITVAQWGKRKNLLNTLNWFIEEFHDEEVGLILKTNTATDNMIDRKLTREKLEFFISKYPDKKCKIYLLHGTVSEGNLAWLYNHPQVCALINIGHGEGFGLPLFEAACNGLPLITIPWSGQADFIYAPNKKGKTRPMISKVDYKLQPVQEEAIWDGVIQKESMWAFADEKSYKKQLRDVHVNTDRCRSAAKRLQKHILKNFTKEDQYQEFFEAFWPENAWGSVDQIDEVLDLEGWLSDLDVEEHE